MGSRLVVIRGWGGVVRIEGKRKGSNCLRGEEVSLRPDDTFWN